MPLIALWSANPGAIAELNIEQIVATAGKGVLKDDSLCSKELREYLGQVPSSKLAEFVDHCLTIRFEKGGMILQDLVNEFGRRLDYVVTNGRYQGTTKAIGFDGLWGSPEKHSIVIEVKTTDAYRIPLDTLAGYRDKLVQSGAITTSSVSILIVVGREDTGELEAQVRGSRHAWDIRIISADALVRLVKLKESAEGTETGRKIRSLLAPMEYTRLDEMIDVMFTAAKDVEKAVEAEASQASQEIEDETASEAISKREPFQFTDVALLEAKRDKIVAAMARREETNLIKNSRALYWNAAHSVRIGCTLSKRYTRSADYRYWYAYHPQWSEFLLGGTRSFLVLGCMDLDFAFAVPIDVVQSSLDALHVTEKPSGRFWHLHIAERIPGEYALLLPRRSTMLSLDQYKVDL
jgi:hypothetical protein